jgi:hypothetical protein
MPPLRLLISEPRPDLIADALKEAVMLGAALVWAAVARLTVSSLMAAPVIMFARAVAVFIMAVIVTAVRLVIITAVAAAAMRSWS